ncbi:MAG: dCTP deaminase, partial [bacterium]|nr:dCTP deaminase [bacterium]
MLLHSDDLRRCLAEPDLSKRLVITPLLDPDRQIGHGAVDLRLGSEFKEVRRRDAFLFDPFQDPEPAEDQEGYEVPIGETLILHPGHFLLGATFECIRLPGHIGGQVLGRSSWGRLGLVVATAATV